MALHEASVVASDVDVFCSKFDLAVGVADLADGKEGMVGVGREDVCHSDYRWEAREVNGTGVC